MARSSQYSHNLQRIDVPSPALDIEDEFPGVLYMKAEGLNDIGKAKNIYTEEYADSDRKRVYLPSELQDGEMVHKLNLIANEGTKVTMTFLIVGDAITRQQLMQRFFNEVRTGIHRYWDDARNRQFDFIVTDEIKVSEEKWHGSQPYVEVQIPMQNLNGKTMQRQMQAQPNS